MCMHGIKSPFPSFSLGGNIIENVCQWPHLGHVITTQCSDIVLILLKGKIALSVR